MLALKEGKDQYCLVYRGFFFIINILGEFTTWISGKRRSPSICFCSCIGAAVSIAVVRGSLTFILLIGPFTRHNDINVAKASHLSSHDDAALLGVCLHGTWSLSSRRW